MTKNYKLSLFTLLIPCMALLTNCNQNEPINDINGECDSRTGNWMFAEVAGEDVCTDLGTAMFTEVNQSRLSVVGFYTGQLDGSISMNINNPAEGTFDLTVGDNDALYATDDETVYYIVDSDEGGSGTLTITELASNRVVGTFAFTGLEIDAESGAPTGGVVEIVNGEFSFELSTSTHL